MEGTEKSGLFETVRQRFTSESLGSESEERHLTEE